MFPDNTQPKPNGNTLVAVGRKLDEANRTIKRMLEVLGYAEDTSHNFAVGACLDRMCEIRDMKECLQEIQTLTELRH